MIITSGNIRIRSDKLTSGVSATFGICRDLSDCRDGSVTIDLSGVGFVTPSFVVPLVVFSDGVEGRVEFTGCSAYQKNLYLPDGGFESGRVSADEFRSFLDGYTSKSYIPLIKFPAGMDRIRDKQVILSAVENMLARQTGLEKNILLGLKYMMSEIADNITDHSNSNFGYIVAQSYPSLGYVDICLGDAGITLLGSYSKKPTTEVSTDREALMAANEGISSKNLPGAENRGYGIRTTRNVITKGLGGQYFMLSGSMAFIATQKQEGYATIPFGLRYRGTIIAIRIPIKRSTFNLYNYLDRG